MLSFFSRIVSRKPDWIPVSDFVSDAAIFSLVFTEGWQVNKRPKKAIHTFYHPDLNGVLQISAYQHPNTNYEYDINCELEDSKRHYVPEIVSLEPHQAIMYAINHDNIHQYCWIIGQNNKKVFITYTTSEPDERKLDIEFQEIVTQLSISRIIFE